MEVILDVVKMFRLQIASSKNLDTIGEISFDIQWFLYRVVHIWCLDIKV